MMKRTKPYNGANMAMIVSKKRVRFPVLKNSIKAKHEHHGHMQSEQGI